MTAFTALVSTVGADARWLVAMGRAVADSGQVPDGVPFAAAPTEGWPNVVVLAELAFAGAYGVLGDRALILLHLAGVAVGLATLITAARLRGASEAAAAVVALAVAVGTVETLVAARLQLFSLLLFPLLLLLLHAEARRPSRRIWLLIPLVAVWSNLHGAVLAGLAVAGAYLILERARYEPLTAGGVLAAAVLAVNLTPALARTPEYYAGVLENEAARRGFGLWEPLSVTSPLGLVLVAVGVLLLVLAVRAPSRAWELVALAGLTLITVRAARSGVWLLMTAAPPAACGLRLVGGIRTRLALPAMAVCIVVATLALIRGPVATGASAALIEDAVRRAGGTPLLAEPLLAEQAVVAGGRVWVANPLDAFRRKDQALYLDWLLALEGGDAALDRAPRVVLVRKESDVEERLTRNRRFVAVHSDDEAVVYVRAGH